MSRKLLLLKPMAAAPVNGAEVSMFERLRILKDEFGWTVKIVCTALEAHQNGIITLLDSLGITAKCSAKQLQYMHNGVDVEVTLGPKLDAYDGKCANDVKQAFINSLAQENPDLVLTNLTDFFALDLLVNEWKGPSVFFITDNEFPRPDTLLEFPELRLIAANIRKIKNAIVASDFLRKSVQQEWDLEARMFLNPVGIKCYEKRSQSTRSFITMVNPIAVKGVDLFLEIARLMPDENFMAVGGWGEELRDRQRVLSTLANVQVVPYEREMSRIYAQSRVVLVPSLWEEAFGRVVLEAFAAGVPVIASDSGGLREAGGTAAMYIPVKKMRFGEIPPAQDPSPWIKAIRMLQDPGLYQERVTAAKKRVLDYDQATSRSMAELNSYLQSLLQ